MGSELDSHPRFIDVLPFDDSEPQAEISSPVRLDAAKERNDQNLIPKPSETHPDPDISEDSDAHIDDPKPDSEPHPNLAGRIARKRKIPQHLSDYHYKIPKSNIPTANLSGAPDQIEFPAFSTFMPDPNLNPISELPEPEIYLFRSDPEPYLADEPRTYKQALKSPEAESWKRAIQVEYNSICSNETWELVELPNDCNIISWWLRPD